MAFYVWQIVAFALSIMRLVDMYNFFTHLLRIPDVRAYNCQKSFSDLKF